MDERGRRRHEIGDNERWNGGWNGRRRSRSRSRDRNHYNDYNDSSNYNHNFNNNRNRGGKFNRRRGSGQFNNYENRQSGPVLMSYKQFIRTLSDDIQPEEAKALYDRHKSEFYARNRSAYFQTIKDETEIRKKYHPDSIEQLIQLRKQVAKEKAAQFKDDYTNDNIVTGACILDEGKDVGVGGIGREDDAMEDNLEGDNSVEKINSRIMEGNALTESKKLIPASSWSQERLKIDLSQAKMLVKKLDVEKELADENPLLEPLGDEMMLGSDNNVEENLEDSKFGHLDLLLEWLWRVHRIDYYGGVELLDGDEVLPVVRTLRPKRPMADDGDPITMDASNGVKASFFEGLDDMWKVRCEKGDALQEKLQINRQEKDLDSFISDKIGVVMDKEKKEYWRCKTCGKMFKAKEFIVKHYKNKHDDLLSDEKLLICERIYEDNYLKYDQQHLEREVGQNMGMMGGNVYYGQQGMGGYPPNAPLPEQMGQMGFFPPGFAPMGVNGGGRGMDNINRGNFGMRGRDFSRQQAIMNKALEIQREGLEEPKYDDRALNQYTDLDNPQGNSQAPVLDYRSLDLI